MAIRAWIGCSLSLILLVSLCTAQGDSGGLDSSGTVYRQKWAIIVGVADYIDESLNTLEFADDDACAFREFVKTPSGGAIPDDHIKFLVNDEATTAHVTSALRSFLKKPGKEDIVLLYFSCHGLTDQQRPKVVYIATHDTDTRDIAGTALPMREINDCIEDYLQAQRVVILADTCHSGAISTAGLRSFSPIAGKLNSYLTTVKNTKPGTAFLTSADGSEPSIEHADYGGGHGAFTYYMLNGLREDADGVIDGEADGVVTIGELHKFITDKIEEDSKTTQTPRLITAEAGKNLPLAFIGGVSARDHLEFGSLLFQQGNLTDELRFFRSAAWHLTHASTLFRVAQTPAQGVRADRLCGLAHLRLRQYGQAVDIFEKALKSSEADEFNDLHYYAGIGYAKLGKSQLAIQHLSESISGDRKPLNAEWISQLIVQLNEENGLKGESLHAVLVGVNQAQRGSITESSLSGPVNDADSMRKLLTEGFNVPAGNITFLTDEAATAKAVLEALKSKAESAMPDEEILFYFSGAAGERTGAEGKEPEYILLAQDADIGVAALREAFKDVRASTLLLFDTDCPDQPTKYFEQLGRSSRFALMIGSSPGQHSYEAEGKGVFTAQLISRLKGPTPDSFEQLIRDVSLGMSNWRQTPILVGHPGSSLILPNSILRDFDYAQPSRFLNFDTSELTARFRSLTISAPYPQIHANIGHALLLRGEYVTAEKALAIAASQSNGKSEYVLAHASAQVRAAMYADARRTLAAHRETLSENDPSSGRILDLENQIQQLEISKRHALLVGINEYQDDSRLGRIESLGGAINDLNSVKRLLIEKLGFDEEDIVTLSNDTATGERVLIEFKKLVSDSRQGVAFFYFAGYGSSDRGMPAIVPVDGRSGGKDIAISSLREIVGTDNKNMVACIDAAFSPDVAARTQRHLPFGWNRSFDGSARGFTTSIDKSIGRHTVVRVSRSPSDETGSTLPHEQILETPWDNYAKKIHGTMTHSLVSSLYQSGGARVSYSEWLNRAHEHCRSMLLQSGPPVVRSVIPPVLPTVDLNQDSNAGGFELISADGEEFVFSNTLAEKQIQLKLQQVYREDPTAIANNAIGLAQRMLEKTKGRAAELKLDLGLLLAQVGELEWSLKSLREASEAATGDNASLLPEIRYHGGRVSLLNGNLNQAVSDLREVLKMSPDNVGARYYLAAAIRELVTQDLLTEAEREFEAYLKGGAPLGHRSEVEEFLNSPRELPGTSYASPIMER